MKIKLFITTFCVIANCFFLKANEPIMLNGKVFKAFVGTYTFYDAPRMFCELIFDNDSVIVLHYTLYYSTNDKRHHCSENKYHREIIKIKEEEEISDDIFITYYKDAIMIEGFDKYGMLVIGHKGNWLYPTRKHYRDNIFVLQKETPSIE